MASSKEIWRAIVGSGGGGEGVAGSGCEGEINGMLQNCHCQS